MYAELVELDKKALKLRNEGDLSTAVELYKKIITKNPNYEFGIIFYNIACCLEDLQEYEEAKINYLKSIDYDKEDDIRLGGYASFLYLHGDPKEAFDAYLNLLRIEVKHGRQVNDLIEVLKLLGGRIGLTNSNVQDIIDEIY